MVINKEFSMMKKIYPILYIIKKVYIVLITRQLIQSLFVNNYIDLREFFIFYNKDFKKNFSAKDKISNQF